MASEALEAFRGIRPGGPSGCPAGFAPIGHAVIADNARYALSGPAELGAHELRAADHRLQFFECNLARQVLHPAVGRDDDDFRRDEWPGPAGPRGDFLRRFEQYNDQID